MQPGDRVCVLGFTSVDYTTIDMALARSARCRFRCRPARRSRQLQPIVAETEPSVIASSVNQLDDAVELILTGHAPAQARGVRLPPRGRRPARRRATAAAARLADTHGDRRDAGRRARPRQGAAGRAGRRPTTPTDPLALLIYTSGSTGAPKGAMYPQSNVGKLWRRSAAGTGSAQSAASITLNFMPMSHVMGRGILYGTLGNGGTAYFAAKSDLSTLLEDLALVRPTELNFVPRIWDMLFGEFQSEVDRRLADGDCRPRGRRSRGDGRAARSTCSADGSSPR